MQLGMLKMQLGGKCIDMGMEKVYKCGVGTEFSWSI